jgi:hypothetical protein
MQRWRARAQPQGLPFKWRFGDARVGSVIAHLTGRHIASKGITLAIVVSLKIST